MSSRLGGGRSLFDEFFSDFFGESPAGRAARRPAQAPGRAASTSRSSSATRRASCCNAPRRRRSTGEASTSTATTCCTRRFRTTSCATSCSRLDADPDAIAAQVEEEAEQGERTDVAPSLSPDAKAALLAAYDESRELGASYVGPEHVLLALARDKESQAGRAARSASASRTRSSAAPSSAASSRQARARDDASTPTLDEFGRDLTQEAREGKLDPVIGRADEIEQTIEILSRRTKNNPALARRAGRGQDRDRRGDRPADRQRRGARDARRTGA